MQKKYIIGIGIAVAVVLVALFAVGSDTVKALESYFDRSPAIYIATTTPTYMTAGTATTTYTFSTANIDKVDVFVNSTASTSLATLNFKFEYSNNNVDWFGESQYTVSSNILYTHSSTTVVHSYLSNSTTASTTRFVTTFPDIASNWKRIVFTVPAGSTNSSVWAEATLKRNTQ